MEKIGLEELTKKIGNKFSEVMAERKEIKRKREEEFQKWIEIEKFLNVLESRKINTITFYSALSIFPRSVKGRVTGIKDGQRAFCRTG